MAVLVSVNCSAQVGKKWLEKAIQAKAKSMEVEAEGDQGVVKVYSDAGRTKEITNLTGLMKVYCSATIHPKAASQASHSSYTDYGLWKGSGCTLNGGDDCKKYFVSGSEKLIERNAMNGKGKAKQETFDFEVDLLEAATPEVENQDIASGTNFFISLGTAGGNKKPLALSAPLTFDVKAGKAKYEAAIIKKNSANFKLPKDLYPNDAALRSKFKSLLASNYGVKSYDKLYFYKDWELASGGSERVARTMITYKSEGKCMVSYFRIWEKLLPNGKWSEPFGLNERTNSMIDCSKFK